MTATHDLVPSLHVDGYETMLSCGPTGTGCVSLQIGDQHFCFVPSTAQWLSENLRKAAYDEIEAIP